MRAVMARNHPLPPGREGNDISAYAQQQEELDGLITATFLR
jgi:hypothetical protein